MEYKYKGREKEYKAAWYQKNKERQQASQKERYQNNKRHIFETCRLWQMRNAEKVRAYKLKNKDTTRFSGNRELVLERDEHQCQVCGSESQLLLHHIDGTENRKKMNANNEVDNLLTLCRSCHLKLHKYKMKI